jgi:wyosine [tRNA(Phe)-imidazoG37] synthetase (radical SAM superfamily)
MYNHLFGPVPSRRLGISLGVDLVPHKTCSLNCIYCECGRTTCLTLERKEYVPTAAILSELKEFLEDNPKLDYITFSGAGEPTLHSGIGAIISFIKKEFSHYKLALITNGTLFFLPGVRKEIKFVDLVLPSLDAASEQTFRKMNHPNNDLKIETIIKGLTDFQKNYNSKMWLEVFIVPGINDAKEEITLLRQAIHRIRPTLVQLNSLDRPGTNSGVNPATEETLQRVADFLDWETEIIAKFTPRNKIANYNIDIENTILQLIKRRPCTLDDLCSTLGKHHNEVNKYLDTLLDQKIIIAKKMERGVFYESLNREI